MNLFACRIPTHFLKFDDKISVALGEPVFEEYKPKLEKEYEEEFIPQGSEFVEIGDGDVKIMRSEQRWGINVGYDEKSGRVWEVCGMYQDKKTDLRDVRDWVNYHRRIGVDRLFIYDNNMENDLLEREFEKRDDVEIVYWPWRKSQETAQNHFLVMAKTRCKWVLLCDADEFVNVGRDEQTLRNVLRNVERDESVGGVSVSSLTMGSSGHYSRPATGSLAEIYRHRLKEDKHIRKPIVLAEDVIPRSRVHNLPLVKGKRSLKFVEPLQDQQPSEDYLFLVHFSRPSWLEFFRKNSLGRSALEVNNWWWGSAFPDPMAEKHIKDRLEHLDVEHNQIPYPRFLKVFRRVMSRTPTTVTLKASDDACVTCWYNTSSVR